MKAFFIIGICTLLFFSCSSGRKAYEKGDYNKAVAQAIKRLRSNGDHAKSQNTLRKAYPLALNVYQRNIERAKVSNDPFKWETVSLNYRQINSLYDELLRCPACRRVIPNPKKFDTELIRANEQAAEVRYALGVEALGFSEDRARAIEAHRHFVMVKNFVPRYRDVEEKIHEALYRATLRVMVEPIPTPVKAFNIRHEFFVNQINEYLHSNRISEYVRFYTPEEVRASNLEYVDHIIQMEFDQFSLGNISSHTTEREVSRDSVEIGKNDAGVIYGTVKAKLKINEKSITGGGILDFKILDSRLEKVITQEKFPGEYTWFAKWATYHGDERALSDDELKLVNIAEVNFPGPQLVFEEFTAPLYDQVIRKIRAYYSRY